MKSCGAVHAVNGIIYGTDSIVALIPGAQSHFGPTAPLRLD